MTLNIASVGIFFMAVTCAIVGSAALVLTLFLRRRSDALSPAMEAYSWFWWFTAITWSFSGLRYLLVSLGVISGWIANLDLIVQVAVFACGPPLLAYTAHRVFNSPRVAAMAAVFSFGLGLLATWFILQPGGITTIDVTAFSAEATINPISFGIFSIQVFFILIGLFYDVIASGRQWWRGRPGTPFEALYSLTIILYLILGTIDESKVMTDWPLLTFRLLYAGIFLFVYLLVVEHQEAKTVYLSTVEHS